MLLKGALHVHTTCSDGTLSIPEVVHVYEALGFDFLALTDHDYLLRSGAYERTLAGFQTTLVIFLGVERTVFEKGYVHVNEIRGDEEVLRIFNHPAELNLPFDKILERIQGTAEQVGIDAVEVTSKGHYTPECDTPRIPYPRLATDDSHTRAGCGKAWIELDCQREKDPILRAIKAGQSWNCFNTH